MKLTLYHFFPKQLNMFGDRGNIIVFKKRCEWRGIELEVVEIRDCQNIDMSKADLIYIGGGPDSLFVPCTEQLALIKDELKAAIDDGVSVLAVSSGYQFFGTHYKFSDGKEAKGLAIFDFYTEAPKKQNRRLVGNIILESETFGTIAGFENHLGRTYHHYEPLGKVLTGYGNNETDKKEGLRYQNFIATYIHGPLLPKNPAIADYLLEAGYKRKTGNKLPAYANDNLEKLANERARQLFLKREPSV